MGFFLKMKIQELHQTFLNTNGVCTDTRNIENNSIFFALKGDNFNGNKFAKQAIESGCLYAVIDEEEFQEDDRFILVDNVLECLQQLATHHRQELKCPVIGITGTNGKTTTKELIFTVLKSQFKTVATKGNLNNHIGVPLTLLSTPLDTEMLIIEMGANHPGEIAFLSEIAQPEFGIITNIGKAHLEGFGGYEGVIKTKSELYQYIDKTKGKLFVNSEDKLLLSLSDNSERILYGGDNSLINANPLVEFSFKDSTISTNLIGAYNYSNLTAACCIGDFFGITIENCKSAIENYTPSNNRSQVKKTNKGNTLILDAYNANPSSMQVAIQSFNRMDAANKIAVLGDMLELGNDSLKEHQQIVKQLLEGSFQEVFLVGREFAQTKSDFLHFENTNQLSDWIQNSPIENSTILLKGSRGIRLESLQELL